MKAKRVFLIVLDSFGIGELPDADKFNDTGSNTLATIRRSKEYRTPNLERLGLFHIDGVEPGESGEMPLGSFGRLAECSMGKDTTIGHWEIAGVISPIPLPVYPDGFPEEIIKPFEEQTGRRVICNRPCSGTDVIRDYGKEQVETGALIVYTSADSVFQIAAHEGVVPLEELYRDCEIARKLLMGEHGVGRVIARPFEGSWPDYRRTTHRHDFSLTPPKETMLDTLAANGYDTLGVGKIYDIFAGRGISDTRSIVSNTDGMDKTIELLDRDFRGLCFVNLVDFDMLYGHRNDVDGYARAAADFDRQLGIFMDKMKADDILIITADHGCDPGTQSTDHSREYIPMLIYGDSIRGNVQLGTRRTFADIGATVLDIFGIKGGVDGESFFREVLRDDKSISDAELIKKAYQAQTYSYSPYSKFSVGAALLGKSGRVYTGCNIENAAFSPTNCAERTAFFKAVSEGEREFEKIVIVGRKGDYCAPCGVCRQVMAEFCNPRDFQVLLARSETDYKSYRLEELLPMGFTKENSINSEGASE